MKSADRPQGPESHPPGDRPSEEAARLAASGQSSAIFARYRRQLTEYAAAMAAVHGGKAVSAGIVMRGGALFKLDGENP